VTPAAAYESLTYLYGSTTATYLNRVERTGDNLDVVAPDYFEVDENGDMKYTKSVDPLLIAAMHDKNITVTPFLSNHWNRANARAMLAKRTQAAAVLAGAVSQHGLDGLDIDIQNITDADRAAFSDFIRLLRAAMPQGKTLTVCVAANPYYTNVGWQGAYDYAELNKYCDHIFIMTYDESFEGGDPGPVASYWFIETSIKYALQYVPKEKIMIGIPFYGRYWTSASKGLAWTLADIEWLVANTDAAVTYDETRACANAVITIPQGTTVTTWGGKKVTGGVYNVWYDNARSFERKLALVREYGIKGVGSWALGQEPASVWDSYAAWLNGYLFSDVRDHWAQSYIIGLKNRGIITGKTDKLFEPEGSLTRAEAAVILVRLALGEPEAGGAPFSDTADHWARDYIAAAYDTELVTGVTDTRFEPNRAVTREEFAALAARYTNIEDAFDMTEPLYSDVSAENNPWSNAAIVKLSLNNVLAGYPDGAFRPGEPITRAQAAKVVTLLAELPTRFLLDEILPLEKVHMGPR
jgi:spore germination protein YaaH